jgi:hypothetical protein
VRIFLADFGDLIGPLLLIAFAVLPRLFKSDKKKKKPSAQHRTQQVPSGPAARPAQSMEMESAPIPEPDHDIPELSELGEVLQELLGRKSPEPAPPPLAEAEFVEYSESQVDGNYGESATKAYESDYKSSPEDPWVSQKGLLADRLTGPATVQRRRKHRTMIANRDSIKDLIVLRDILGPPRSLQPIEDWDSGGS